MAQILPLDRSALTQAARLLNHGGLVALPTETVYGLAANARQKDAVAKIYKAKGRPAHNPLILHITDPDQAGDIVHVGDTAAALIGKFWPGPLTLVLPRKANTPPLYTGPDLETLALRCPDTPWRKDLRELGFCDPLVMPSANRSGHISPTTAQHVADDLGARIDLILDNGPCLGGIESTIIQIFRNGSGQVLRDGLIPRSKIAPFIALKAPNMRADSSSAHHVAQDAPIAPGLLKSHYAPRAKVRLGAEDRRPGEAYLAFGKSRIKSDYNLSPTAELKEAARNLYAALRQLDRADIHTIAIASIPMDGIGAAINDRLKRAAAERDGSMSAAPQHINTDI